MVKSVYVCVVRPKNNGTNPTSSPGNVARGGGGGGEPGAGLKAISDYWTASK